MDLRVLTEPQQGASYDTQLAVAKAAEDLGFDGFFRSDHYLMNAGSLCDGLPGPTDAWLTLAGLARETSRIRLGTLVTPATFRLPGVLAIQVAQVDAMSGGRVELGLGAGWYEGEHTAYGIPFPDDRFSHLEEQLQIVTGLWGTKPGDTYDFDGEHYRLTDSPALPKPVQSPHPPIIIGGSGPKRTPRLAAKYADEYNSPFRTPEITAGLQNQVREACSAIGRDPESLTYSATLVVCCGRTEAEIERRAAAIAAVAPPGQIPFACTPDQLVERIEAYRESGTSRCYLRTLDVADLDHLELIASEVMPQL
jgi:F420-dependent oxidoreductase-like protein